MKAPITEMADFSKVVTVGIPWQIVVPVVIVGAVSVLAVLMLRRKKKTVVVAPE
jgi:hypothetical protein